MNPVLIPDMMSIPPLLTNESAACEPGPSSQADTVRYLSDLWQNLTAIHEILALERLETSS
jgi:hypothetical protein